MVSWERLKCEDKKGQNKNCLCFLSSLGLVSNNIGKVGGIWGFGVGTSVVWKKILPIISILVMGKTLYPSHGVSVSQRAGLMLKQTFMVF